jgi:4'-phosphopantetheinyl transferase
VSDLMNINDVRFEAPSRLSLPENEVQLWRIELDAVAAGESRWRGMLCSEEQARADRFHFARDRQNFSATRALLRILLGAYTECRPEQLIFGYGERDKPSLAGTQGGASVEFNVSHSGCRGLLAFARGRELGVDIEQIRNNFDHQGLARRYFSAAEQQALSALPPAEKCAGFFRCWTRKEAYIKAHGAGLSLPLSAFDVSLIPDEQNALLATRPDAGEAALWSLREVRAGEGYAAALCVRGNGWTLKS